MGREQKSRLREVMLCGILILFFFTSFVALTESQTRPQKDALLEGFRQVAVASVSDAVDQVTGERGFLNYDIRPIVGGRLVGRARTVVMKPAPAGQPGPGGAVSHTVEVIDSSGPGEVIVVVIEDGLNVAAIGGLMGTAAKVRNVEGFVIDGGVRDVSELRNLALPVYARSITPATAVGRYQTTDKDVPVRCGGILVRPGDILVADEDGVVRVPKEKAEEVLKIAQSIDERESKMVPFIKKHRSLGKAIEAFQRI